MTSFRRSCVRVIIGINRDTPGFRREADNLLETKIGLRSPTATKPERRDLPKEEIGRLRRTRSRMTPSWATASPRAPSVLHSTRRINGGRCGVLVDHRQNEAALVETMSVLHRHTTICTESPQNNIVKRSKVTALDFLF
jgi:hypothetical protein